MSKFLITLLFITTISSAHADNLLLLSSGRNQMINNCWAHAGASMLESQFETSSGISVVTELGKDLQVLNVYNRLMNSYRTKTSFEGGSIGAVEGWVGEYFKVLSKFGLLVRKSNLSNKTINYEYPRSAEFSYRKIDIAMEQYEDLHDLEKKLISGKVKSEAEADKLIRAVLSMAGIENVLTRYMGQTIERQKTFELLLPNELSSTGIHPIAVTVFAQSEYPQMQLGWGVQGTLDFFVVPTKQDIINLIHYNLDNGYVSSVETKTHAMASLGYKTINLEKKIYSYAISDSLSGIHWSGLSNLNSSTMFYNVVEKELEKLVPGNFLLIKPQVVKGVFKLKK